MEQISNTKENNHIDVTKEWLKNATPNSHRIVNAKYFESDSGIRYYVDGKYVKLDYSQEEKDTAQWLKHTFGGKIYMIPKVDYPKNIKTADYLFNDEYYDLKSICGSGKRVIDYSIKKQSKQSQNFIIDISKSNLSINNILVQVEKIYNTKGREWVKTIIIKKENKLIKVYTKKD